MTVVKNYCDFCGDELSPCNLWKGSLSVPVFVFSHSHENFDLCSKCARHIRNYIHSKGKEPENDRLRAALSYVAAKTMPKLSEDQSGLLSELFELCQKALLEDSKGE